MPMSRETPPPSSVVSVLSLVGLTVGPSTVGIDDTVGGHVSGVGRGVGTFVGAGYGSIVGAGVGIDVGTGVGGLVYWTSMTEVLEESSLSRLLIVAVTSTFMPEVLTPAVVA